MYLKQADLFWGMSQGFIQSITARAVKQEFKANDTIFKSDDAAKFFYVLIQGKVRLVLKQSGQQVYTSDRIGEIFGWSALIGRPDYAADVICEAPTLVLRFKKEDVTQLLENDAENAVLFYRQLAGALGNRLLQAYDLLV